MTPSARAWRHLSSSASINKRLRYLRLFAITGNFSLIFVYSVGAQTVLLLVAVSMAHRHSPSEYTHFACSIYVQKIQQLVNFDFWY